MAAITFNSGLFNSHVKNKNNLLRRKVFKGMSFVEMGVVTAIIILIAAIGIPAINNFVTENRAPKVAEELQRFIARTKAASESASSTPYAGIKTENLARSLRSSSVVKVLDQATIEHRLGGGATGLITLAENSGGRAFQITMANVNEIVCPSMATILQSVSDTITVNGTTVKETNLTTGAVTTDYNASIAQNSCTEDNTNNFVFITR